MFSSIDEVIEVGKNEGIEAAFRRRHLWPRRVTQGVENPSPQRVGSGLPAITQPFPEHDYSK
jgi:hypothetical protein